MEKIIKHYVKLGIRDREKQILTLIATHKEGVSQSRLSQELKISQPLLSYYVNGNGRNDGFIKLGLVERVKNEKDLNIGIKITETGQIILNLIQ